MGSLDLLLKPFSEGPVQEARAAAVREITVNVHMHIALINARAWTDTAWRRIVDDNFLSNTNAHCFNDHTDPDTSTRDEYLATCQVFTSALPDFRLEVAGLSVAIDEPEDGEDALPQSATSWMCTRSRGWGDGLRQQSVGWMRWRKGEDGEWRACRHVISRGAGWLEE